MEKKILKVNPFFEARMWGGERLVKDFHYTTDISPIGEVYNVVALKNHADCYIEELGITLSEMYQAYPEWFVCDTEELPIRVNILDPEADLSIQIHPQDAFAKSYNGGRGKPEAWVILDAPEDGYIAFGHYAQSKKEFADMVETKDFKSLVKYIDVVVGDYLDIPCGTLHAIGKGVLTYNISRNADCTLRVYDYDRIDPATNETRELHVQEVIDNVNIPDQSKGFVHYPSIVEQGCEITSYWNEPGLYTLKRICVKGMGTFDYTRFGFYTIVDGEGTIEGIQVKKGETIFVPDHFGKLNIRGEIDMFLASYENVEESD